MTPGVLIHVSNICKADVGEYLLGFLSVNAYLVHQLTNVRGSHRVTIK